ncbi:MAG: class I adenylate-forming enzyme family protein [Solirubrobacteraceae bacterium]
MQTLSPLRAAVARVAAIDPGRLALIDGARALSYGALDGELSNVSTRRDAGRETVRLGPSVPELLAYLARSASGESLLVVDPGTTEWELQRAAGVFAGSAPGTGEDRPTPHVLGLCTSGTGGLPRVVDLDWEGVLANALSFGIAAGYRAGDRIWVSTPVAHLYGLGAGVIAGLLHGASVVLAAGAVGPGEFAERVSDARITVLLSVPFLLRRFVSELADHGDGLPLRATVAAGEPVGEELVGAWRQHGGGPLRAHYGLTEGGHITLASGARDEGVGAPLPGVELRLDGGGEISVRRTTPARPYRVAGEAPSPDGWRATGDRGYLDVSGNLHITGRNGDRINVAGKKVDPTEVEQELLALAGVRDCAVAGVRRAGEEQVVAFVRVCGDVTDAELRAALRARLSAFKLPRRIVRVAGIPRTATGKVRRGQLIAELQAAAEPQTIGLTR